MRPVKRPTWEQPWYAWVSLSNNFKRWLWAVAVVVVPIVLFYYVSEFLYAELSTGRWWWYLAIVAAVIISNWLLGLSTGAYGFYRKSPPRRLPLDQSWVGEVSRSD